LAFQNSDSTRAPVAMVTETTGAVEYQQLF
jgi:hypothetical protein